MSLIQPIKQSVRLVFSLILVAAALVITHSYGIANAQTTTANVLRVSPVRNDIVALPGDTKTVEVTVTNVTNADITVRPSANDFVASDERGTPALILDENEYAPAHSLKRFMGTLEDFDIPAGKAVTIDVVVTVPQDADAGGYYGAIRFSPTSPDGGGQVNLSASVASLILLTVPGDVVEKLDLTSFDIQQSGRSSTFFTDNKGIELALRFENKGGSLVGPFGKVSVKNGKDVVYETDFNNESPRDMVLPGSARRWEVPLNDIGSFGYYTVTATFTYGQANQSIEIEKSFWVIPVWAIIAGIAAIVILIAGIILTVVLVRRRVQRSRRPRRIRR